MTIFLAYIVTNSVDGKQYVGVTSNLTQRWSEHLRPRGTGARNTFALHRAIAEHGPSCFSIEVVASAKTRKDINAVERTLIDQYQTLWWYGGGYNMTLGGEGVDAPRTPEWKAKIGAAPGHRSAEKRAKVSAARRGKVTPPELRARLSAALKGRPGRSASPEGLARLSALFTGKPLSNEHRKKLSEAAWQHRGVMSQGSCCKVCGVQFSSVYYSPKHGKMKRQRRGAAACRQACLSILLSRNATAGDWVKRSGRTSKVWSLSTEVARRIAGGENIHSLCKEQGMPSKQTLRRWIENDHRGFATLIEQLRRANKQEAA